jgi:predicted DNA-binding ribbon-helix-helix protein
MKSAVVKRSVIVGGHKTSISLEDAFWGALKEIAQAKGSTVTQTVSQIDETRQQGNLSSAIRLFVLGHVRNGTNGPAGLDAYDASAALAGCSANFDAFSSHDRVCTSHPVCSNRADSPRAGDLRVGNGSPVASRTRIARTSKLPCSCRSSTERLE